MKTVLIVDDDNDDIQFLRTAIKFIDASVQCIDASNAQEALKLLNDEDLMPPDYIFLDLNMPRVGGDECLRKIKNISRLEKVPVILYSTSKFKDKVIERMKMGAVYFLTKPTKLSVLKTHVSNIFEGKWELVES